MEINPRLSFEGTPEPGTGIEFVPMKDMAQMWQENKRNKRGKTFQEAILELERRHGGVFEWRKALHYSGSDNLPDDIKIRLRNNQVLRDIYNNKVKKEKENENINN